MNQPLSTPGDLIVFLVLALSAVGMALTTITRRNPVSSVMALVGTFLALAGIYATLDAHFITILQVSVYAGAIMVLFIFVVMILNRDEVSPILFCGIFTRPLGVVAGLYLTIVFFLLVLRNHETVTMFGRVTATPASDFGTVQSVGHSLFVDFVFPFEAISVLLLVAVVGGLVVSRSSKQERHAEDVARQQRVVDEAIHPEQRLGEAAEPAPSAHGHH